MPNKPLSKKTIEVLKYLCKYKLVRLKTLEHIFRTKGGRSRVILSIRTLQRNGFNIRRLVVNKNYNAKRKDNTIFYYLEQVGVK